MTNPLIVKKRNISKS